MRLIARFFGFLFATGAILFVIGVGLANTCGVANAAKDFPTVRYEVSGPAVAEYISYQTDTGQQHPHGRGRPQVAARRGRRLHSAR